MGEASEQRPRTYIREACAVLTVALLIFALPYVSTALTGARILCERDGREDPGRCARKGGGGHILFQRNPGGPVWEVDLEEVTGTTLAEGRDSGWVVYLRTDRKSAQPATPDPYYFSTGTDDEHRARSIEARLDEFRTDPTRERLKIDLVSYRPSSVQLLFGGLAVACVGYIAFFLLRRRRQRGDPAP